MNLRQLVLAATTFGSATLPTHAQEHAAFVLDLSGSMGNYATLTSRCRVSRDQATLDATFHFLLNPTGTAGVFGFSSTVTQYASGANLPGTLTALNSLPNCGGCTALGDAICDAVAYLVAQTADPNERVLYIYSDGDGNCAPTPSCIRVSGTGAIFPSDSNPSHDRCPCDWGANITNTFTAGTWQDAACAAICGNVTVNVYFFDDFAESTAPPIFGALTSATGGNLVLVDDGTPARDTWRSWGAGCTDFRNTQLAMRGTGVPSIGSTVQVGVSTSNPLPALISIGSAAFAPAIDLGVLGAQGCSLYATIDATFPATWGTEVPIQIPNDPALPGAELFFQGFNINRLNNVLGVATANVLRMTIVQ